MKIHAPKSRLRHLPRKTQLALFLIGEELKSRKLFHVLAKVGFDYSFYQPHLDSAILSCIGLDHESDDVFGFYFDEIEERCTKIKDDPKSVMKHALKVYMKLDHEKNVTFNDKDDDPEDLDLYDS